MSASRRWATEIRLWAERRAGELLAVMEKAKGGNPNLSSRDDGLPTLKALGISRDQSSAAWQQLERQRGMVAARLANLEHGQRADYRAANLPVFTQEQAAERLGVSERTVRAARAVLDRGTPELVAASGFLARQDSA